MNRKGISAFSCAPLFKEIVKNIFQTVCLCYYGKMVCSDSAAVFVVKCLTQQLCKRTQQIIAICEAMPCIVEFHPGKIHVQKRRSLPTLFHLLFRFLHQFEEPSHTRETGKIVVAARLQNAFFVERFAHGTVQDRTVRLFIIYALVSIPDMGKLRTIFQKHVFTKSMNNPVIRRIINPCTIDFVVITAFCRKAYTRIPESGSIVRVNVLIHIVIHVIISGILVIIAEQRAETV